MPFSTVKRILRLIEARLSPLENVIRFEGRDLRVVRSMWWYEEHQSWFDAEIIPYFIPLFGDKRLSRIVDAGGSTGMFALAAATRFPDVTIDVFEPSPRQRIMIARNACKNAMSDRIRVHPFGLWNEQDRLAFRSHGSISSLQKVTMLDRSLAFEETVDVTSLDTWAAQEKIEELDLIKMDIEGAEIEALAGATETLKRFRPQILLQAYHIRDGVRTLERCLTLLEGLGYSSREVPGVNGFVHAHVP